MPEITDAMVQAAALVLHLELGSDPEPPEPDEQQAWRNAARAALEAALDAVRHVGPVIDSWPMWWCPACGTRYADGTVHDGLCGDGHELQPVTLQLVTRSAGEAGE